MGSCRALKRHNFGLEPAYSGLCGGSDSLGIFPVQGVWIELRVPNKELRVPVGALLRRAFQEKDHLAVDRVREHVLGRPWTKSQLPKD